MLCKIPIEMIVNSGDYVLLLFRDDKSFLIKVKEGQTFSTHVGSLKHDDIVGKEYGEAVNTHMGNPFIILEPTLTDRMKKVKRLTQIIYPKDAGLILLKTGAKSDMRVIECGAGSGAFTIVIANAVAPTGRVYSYDFKEEFLENAKRNVSEAGYSEVVEFKLGDVNDGFDEEEVDIVFLDLPFPWEGIPPAAKALRGGGRISSVSPTYNQVEKTVSSLKLHGFVYIQTIEILLREMKVLTGRSRPYDRMVGHTAFLTFARKALVNINERDED